MKTLPLDIGVLHFVGIGGIGMSGIAETLHELGYQVRGSDIADSANVGRLRDAGIAVSIGHRAENVDGTAVVVVSTAIDTTNPEVAAARQQRIPVVRRAEMLAELMRLKWSVAVGGTHGKTTTTSMVAAVLDAGGIDPTVINGGIINAYGTNARLGDGDWMVVEADESDGTFIKLPATIAVVTNIDPEHLDFYGDFDAVRDAFATFVSNIPFYGFAAMCIDHPEVQALIPRFSDRRIVSYGMSPQAEVRGVNVTMAPDGARFDVELARRDRAPMTISGLQLPMLGRHNVQNALAAIAVGLEMGLETAAIARGLANFAGVKRRFTRVGDAGGISVIDDYGHHPVEIGAVLRAAREGCQGRVFAVFQPHRFSRVASLFEEFCTCFNDADVAIVTDIYPAGESPMEGVDRTALVAGLQAHGHRDVRSLPTTYGAGAPSPTGTLAAMIAETARPGDMVVCLGAGNITAWAQELPAALAARLDRAGLDRTGIDRTGLDRTTGT